MTVKQESGVNEFTFVPLQDHNGDHDINNYHTQQQQPIKYYTGYDTSLTNDFLVDDNFHQQIATPIKDETSPPSNQQFYSQPQTLQQNNQRQFYQHQSYSQPELQHISRFNMSSNSINEFHIKEENEEEELTIESILDDDPLLSFTTTLDRQESNDTILQSSSPIKGPYDAPYDEIENLSLNHHNHSQASFVKQPTPENTSSISPPMNNFPTPANSTTSGATSNRSPNNKSTGQYQQQHHSQSQLPPPQQQFQQTFQIPYHPQQSQQIQQQFQPPQPQFLPQYNSSSNASPTSASPTDTQFVPVTVPTNGSNISTPGMIKMESSQTIPQQQQQTPVQNFRMQIQNQAFFQPQLRNANFPQPGAQQSGAQISQQQQQFVIQRPNAASIQRPPSLQHHHSTSSIQTTKASMKIHDMKLPPTPPSGREPSINKSSSTTKSNKVKKSSFSGPSTSTLKLKKSKSFLNSSPSMKDSKPFFTTLDFSKQLNPSHNTFINKDNKKFPKTGMKINVIKNYEFVLEPGHDRNLKHSTSSSSGNTSNKTTPRRPSNVGTPTSTTSTKFPKLPKPPAIEKSSFSMYSPTNPASSPNSDTSGQSPLNSSQTCTFVNPSPIPSSIASFDNTTMGDSSFNGSSPITHDQVFFKPSSSKRSPMSQTSPEKQPSPPSFRRDMKSGLNEFKVRTHK